MRPLRIFGFYALPLVLIAVLFALFAGLGARLHGGALSLPETLPAGIMVQPGAILQGQALRIGEAIANGTTPATAPGIQRPVGSFVYTRDGTQAFIKTGTAATAWGASGGGGATKTDTLNSRAATLMGSAGISCFHEEYVYGDIIASYTAGLGGSATLALDAGNSVGSFAVMSTGATIGSTARFVSAGNVIGRPDTNRFYIGFRAAFTTAANATVQFEVGVANGGYGTTLGLGVCGATSQNFFQAIYDSAATCNGTKISTGVLIDAVSHYFEIWTVADGKVHFAVDLTEIPTSPFTMTGSPTTSLRAYSEINNLTTALNSSAKLDYFHLCWNESP